MNRRVVLATLLILGFARTARAEEVKLGFVNMARAIEETEEGRKTKATLRKELETKQKELDEQQENLKKAMEDLEKKRSLLPPDTIKQRETEIRGSLEKVQQSYLRHQQELAGKEQQAMGSVVGRMQRIIAKIAQTENLTMVFDQNQAGLLYAKPHLDMTNELIRRFNGGEGGDGAAGAKKPAAPAAKPKK